MNITDIASHKGKLYVARDDETFWEYCEDEGGNKIWKQLSLPPQVKDLN